MNLGSIIAKLLGKPKSQSDATTGWGGWLDTPEGKLWEAVGETVYDELDEAKVNVHKRRIILGDGQRLTINQAARRITDKSGHDIEAVRENVMLWLEEVAIDSDDEDRDADVDIRTAIDQWVHDARSFVQPSR